jgi:acetylglutamate kinase
MTEIYDQNIMMGALKKALPYIRLYRNKLFVVKTGGAIFEDKSALREMVEQLGVLNELGARLVLVHGGGVQTTELATKLGVETNMVNGRRVTDEKTLEISTMTLNGSINTKLIAACRAQGLNAAGVSGVDAGLIRATRRPPQQVNVNGDKVTVDYGLVGDIQRVDAKILNSLLDAGVVPIVSPISCDEQGQLLNINADTVAARIAAEMGAEKLIFMGAEMGILENIKDSSSLISYTDIRGLDKLKEKGIIDKGMLPKANAAREALLGGVRRVHMVTFTRPSSLLVEIFTNEGSGTLIVKDTMELLPAEQQAQT